MTRDFVIELSVIILIQNLEELWLSFLALRIEKF